MSRISTVALVIMAMAAPAAAATNAELADQLRKAESGFARSMADRDHKAFTSYLATVTVFFGGKGVHRGSAAVAAAWKPFFEKPEAPFSWAPAEAEVLDSGTLGMTSGPVYDPSGQRIGTFNSLWRRRANGSWEIVFDKGCPPCDCGAAKP